MNTRILRILMTSLMIMAIATLAVAGEKPDITRYDAHYLDHVLSVSIQWQSPNPVTKVIVTAGRDQKELKVDEYDNRRNPSGYEGEVSTTVTVDPSYQLDPIPFILQLEDDLRQKSPIITGKATIPGKAAGSSGYASSGYGGAPAYGSGGGYDDGWGREKLSAQSAGMNQGAQGGSGDIVDKLIGVMERHDTPPSFDEIKVNIHSGDNVSFTSRANDDKGLREVRFRIHDNYGNIVQEQTLTGLGKLWQGTSQPFRLQGGSYRVTGQAFDSTGNTSKEQTANFTMTGEASPLPPNTYVSQPQTYQPSTGQQQQTQQPYVDPYYQPSMPQQGQSTTGWTDQQTPAESQPTGWSQQPYVDPYTQQQQGQPQTDGSLQQTPAQSQPTQQPYGDPYYQPQQQGQSPTQLNDWSTQPSYQQPVTDPAQMQPAWIPPAQ